MTPFLSLQFNPVVPSAVAGADALPSVTAGADFLQALQQWLAQIQQSPVAPVFQPQAPAPETPAPGDGRTLLASLLAAGQQVGQGNGSTAGEDGAPATLETAQDALALFKQLLSEAGDTSRPGIGEAVSARGKPGEGGEELPAGEELPPDALATLSALSRQLEHWLRRAEGDAETGGGEAVAKEIQPAAPEPSPALQAAMASGLPVVPVQAATADVPAPDREEASAAGGRLSALGPLAALAGKTASQALQPDAGEQPYAGEQGDFFLRPAAMPQVPSAGRAAPNAAPQSASTTATNGAAPAAVPPPPVAPAFSAVRDELTPPAALHAPAAPSLPDAAPPPVAQAVAPNSPAAVPERPAPPPVATPVGHPGWDTEVSQRVVWMTGNAVSSAEIHLNPPHLGPVEVRISVNQDQQTTVQFVSPHAAVREALEAALPKLREQFGAQQLILGDVSVSQHTAGQQSDGQQARGFQFQQQQQSSPWRGAQPEFSMTGGAGLAEEGERTRPVRVAQGLLNLYV